MTSWIKLWNKRVKLLIDDDGQLSSTQVAVIVMNDDTYGLDLHHVKDGYYQLTYGGDTIGGISQNNNVITGEINMGAIDDTLGVYILTQLSRHPEAFFLMKKKSKSKFRPDNPEFLENN